MLDIKLIREHSPRVKDSLASRGAGDDLKVDELLELDARRRSLLAEVETSRAKRNQESKAIGSLLKEKRHEEAEQLKREMRSLGEKIADLEARLTGLKATEDELMLTIPNLPHESVARGASTEDNPLIREWGEQRSHDFPLEDHLTLCERLKLVDFVRGAKLAGSGFPLYTGWGARLERALIQYMLQLHTSEHRYVEVSPPFVVTRDCMEGVGQFPKFVDQAYAVQEGEDAETLGKLWLVPTAEAPVANIHREEILPYEALPIRYCAYSPCFRAEAGAAGVGTRGMIRMHQFDKVELIKVVAPEESYEELESMVQDAERVLRRLELRYRVIMLCTGDLGFGSAKTYDIEVWAPGQGDWLEVSSCSNCEDFQARRMALRYKAPDKQNRFPHLLNGSGTALARLFVALVETHQQPDGSILIPEALRSSLQADRLTSD